MPRKPRRDPRAAPGPSLLYKRGGARRDEDRSGDFRPVHRVSSNRAHGPGGRALAALVSLVAIVPLSVATGLLRRCYGLEKSHAYRLATSVLGLAPGWMGRPNLSDLGLGAAPELQSFLVATPEWGALRSAGYGIPPEPAVHDEMPREVQTSHVSLGREVLRAVLGHGWTLAQDAAAVEAMSTWSRRNWCSTGPAGRYTQAAQAWRDGRLRWVEGARLSVLLPPPDASDARIGDPLVRPPLLLLGGQWTPDAHVGRLAELLRLLRPYDVVCCARASASERDPYVASVRRLVGSKGGLDLGRTVTDHDPVSRQASERPESWVRVLPTTRGVEWQGAWRRLHASLAATEDAVLKDRLTAFLGAVI